MNLGMEENLVKVLLDTNILISAIAYGGKPAQLLYYVLEEKITAITSPVLLSELKEVLNKKFPLREADFKLTVKNIEEIFKIAHPKMNINILKDDDDNRVLEAAIEGKCNYIATGDKELLDLGSFKEIRIVTADKFLKLAQIYR